MIKENKGSKYLLYAIGEIVLVVIGILIALSINNWNENQKDRLLERKILSNLAENLESNCSLLNDQITRLKHLHTSGSILISAIDEKQVYSDSLENHFFNAFLTGIDLVLPQVGYETLKQTGFEIIQNDSLQTEVIKLFENKYKFLFTQLNGWGMEDAEFKGKYIDEQFAQFRVVNKIDLINQDILRYKPFNPNYLMNDNYFYALLRKCKLQREWFSNIMMSTLEDSQSVLKLINEELKE
jgi:hypothetical protein